MFNSNHYVPILKWKRAEKSALSALSKNQKKYITPLVQFVMPKNKHDETRGDVISRFEEKLTQIPKELIDSWGTNPIFVDISLLYGNSLKTKSIKSITLEGSKLGGVFIPAIHLSDDQEIKNAAVSVANRTKSGLCLRLICPDFFDLKKLNQNIKELLSSNKLKEKDIDLLVDIKETEGDSVKCIKYLKLSQNIPNLTDWRTFIFASGSFPKDLSYCKIDEENLIPRIDWKIWKEKISNKNMKRKPAFADYTIQYPIYEEIYQFYHPTASIKYTLEDCWWILKGKKQKFSQYLAHAAILVKDRRFFSEEFSHGDNYIAEKANHFSAYIQNPSVGGTGSTETWLIAGINHHLALVAHQIANLS